MMKRVTDDAREDEMEENLNQVIHQLNKSAIQAYIIKWFYF